MPYLKSLAIQKGVEFKEQEVTQLDEVLLYHLITYHCHFKLADNGYDIIINCAGLNGGKMAGDDDTVYPIRGVVLDVEAPWHKHFNYRDFITFTIPK